MTSACGGLENCPRRNWFFSQSSCNALWKILEKKFFEGSGKSRIRSVRWEILFTRDTNKFFRSYDLYSADKKEAHFILQRHRSTSVLRKLKIFQISWSCSEGKSTIVSSTWTDNNMSTVYFWSWIQSQLQAIVLALLYRISNYDMNCLLEFW